MVNDALTETIADLEREELERAMREGNEFVDHERAEIDSEWQATETEHWPN
jgi:hypothetical protein